MSKRPEELQVVASCAADHSIHDHISSRYGAAWRMGTLAASMGLKTTLHTFAPPCKQPDVVKTLSRRHLRVSIYDGALSLSYQHWEAATAVVRKELHTDPSISPCKVLVEASSVLHSCIDEADVVVRAQTAVYAINGSATPRQFRANGSDAARLAYVLSTNSAQELTGESLPEMQLSALQALERPSVVILGLGAKGNIVANSHGTKYFHAVKPSNVMPFGEIDVRATAFASVWLNQDSDTEAAFHRALAAEAAYNSTGIPGFDPIYYQTKWGSIRPAGGQFKGVVGLCGGKDSNKHSISLLVTKRLETAGLAIRQLAGGRPTNSESWTKRLVEALEDSQVLLALVTGSEKNQREAISAINSALNLHVPVVVYIAPKSEWVLQLAGAGCTISHDLTTAVSIASWIALEG